MTSASHPQLPLNLSRRPNADFRSFVGFGNEQLLSRLQQVGCDSPQFIFIWGAAEVGKSHLLQASCQQTEERCKVFYLNAEELLQLAPEVLAELYDFDFVAIDDLNLLLGKANWEEALFHLYNQLKDANKSLLVSADQAPRYLEAKLPDLASRLAAMEIYQVSALEEEGKQAFLTHGADHRGFALSDDVVSYVLSRSDRSLSGLHKVLEKLDHRSLQEKRLITVPFVKKVMGW